MKKDYPIKVGEQTYLLRFNYNALTLVEDVTGKSFFEVLGNLGHLKNMKIIMWAGLRKNHADIDLDDVGELLDDCDDLKALFEELVKAVNNYFSARASGSKKKTDQPSSNPTGESTGQP